MSDFFVPTGLLRRLRGAKTLNSFQVTLHTPSKSTLVAVSFASTKLRRFAAALNRWCPVYAAPIIS